MAYTEQEILATLRALAEHRTTISIAHRLSTIVDADRILVLDQGRLAESGNHLELLRFDGRLRPLQFQRDQPALRVAGAPQQKIRPALHVRAGRPLLPAADGATDVQVTTSFSTRR